MSNTPASSERNPKYSTIAVFVLFLTSTLYWLGFSMARPAVALYLAETGMQPGAIGVVIAVQALAPFVLAIPAGSLIDRIGYRKALAMGSLLMGASCAVYAGSTHLDSIGLLIAAQIMNGCGSLFSWGALQASVAVLSRSGEAAEGAAAARARHLIPNFTFFTSLAQLVGPSLSGIVSDYAGYASLFVAAGAVTAASFALAPLIPALALAKEADAPKLGSEGRQTSWYMRFLGTYKNGYEMMRTNRVFFLGILLNGVLFILVDVRMTFFPIYMSGLHFTNTQIGFALSAGGVAAVIIRPLVGVLMSYVDHMRLMLSSIVLGAACLLVLAFGPSYGIILIVMFLWGACTGINQPLAMLVVANSVGMEKQGMGMSLRTMSNRVVQLVNPVAFGGVTALVGLATGFGLLAFLLAAITGLFYLRQHQHKARPEVPVPGESQAK